MLTVNDFIMRFPEFEPAVEDGLVQVKLDEAEDAISKASFGARFDEAHGYLAAHLLAISPFARNVRIADDQNNPMSYWERFKQVRAEAVPRMLVTGCPVG